MNTTVFFNGVNLLIETNRKTYTDSPKRFISDYNHEVELTKEYNGRQILELLQNADDADSKSVHIKLDTDEKKLVIANIGDSFSTEGIESLMMANLSSKTKKIYIGNKGLGFRSILNWADRIVIKTNGCLVEFSSDIAKEEFLSLKIDEDLKASIIKDRGLSEDAIPFPILSIPRITIDETPQSEWTTVIEIYYKEVEDNEKKIELQLLECQEEILLFLNNISNISIEGLKNEKVVFNRTKLTENDLAYIQISDKIWRVETFENFLPESLQEKNKIEKESYNITIAFQDDLSDTYYKLFNFFPTKLSVYLPCIIHATFELNSSRDYLNDSPKNEFILDQIINLLKNTSLKLAEESAGNSDWRPFKLLLPIKNESDSKLINKFYDKLKKTFSILSVFPTMDGGYKMIDDIKYYGKSFSEWIIRNNFKSYFPELLLPEEKVISSSFPIQYKNHPQFVFSNIVDSLSFEIDDLEVRAELISLFLEDPFRQYRAVRYSLLVNDDNKIIDKSNVVFTPAIESDGIFIKPDFIQIDFINQGLYNILIKNNSSKFTSQEQESRVFNRVFKEIVNVQPYDSNNVITRIISGTKDKIKQEKNEEAINDIKLMIQSLFQNYKSLKNKTETFTLTCLLVNKLNEIKESDSLFINSSFRSGKLTEQLYEGILSEREYVEDASFYGIYDQDLSTVEAFFIWLGVNKFVQFTDKKIYKENWERDDYLDFVFTKVQRPNPVSRYIFSGKEIGHFNETVAKLSNEKLILLILKETRIQHSLDFINSDRLQYQYSQSYPNITEKPSYILYQISLLQRFNNFIIESYDIPFVNKIQLNFEDPLFKYYNVLDNQIFDVLIKLGAKRSLADLDTSKVYEFIKYCGDNNIEQKYARKLYLQAFEHYKALKKDIKTSILPDTKVLAIKNGQKDYRRIEDREIYYSDNSTLPEKITRDFWIFDFPKRLGVNQVTKFFGIRTFKEINLNVKDTDNSIHPMANEFEDWFNKIKPLILAYRISSLKGAKEKQDAANSLKNCSIRLLSEVSYSMYDGNIQKLGYEEFIASENQFYLCVESHKKLEQFKGSLKFCGAFAEIMCILFKVNESKNSFISVFQNKIEFSKDLIKSDSLDEYLAEAYTLMGLSQLESDFWEAICKIKSIQWLDNISNEQQLRKFISTNLDFKLPSDYSQIDFIHFANNVSFKFIQSIVHSLGISLNKLHVYCQTFQGLFKWHLSRVKEISIDVENQFANTVWYELSTKGISEQKQFLKKRNEFQNWLDNYDWSEKDLPPFLLEFDYNSILKEKVRHEFKIDLIDISEPIRILSEYIEILVDHDEIEKSFSLEQKSLLYFEGHEDEIHKVINSFSIHERSKSKEVNKEEPILLPIVESNFQNVAYSSSHYGMHDKTGKGVVSPKRELEKRRAGKRAELKVRDALVVQYGRMNVQWVSGNSDESKSDDTLGYDIRYRETLTDEWCFLEVKSISGNSFIISNNELNVAFNNKTRYHLALVKAEKIYIDKVFFKNSELENEYNLINSGLSIKPVDYEVFVNINIVTCEIFSNS